MIFIGGSIVNHGGQNPIEPARYGLSIVHGPNVRNFKDIFKFFKEKKLAFKINNQNQLTCLLYTSDAADEGLGVELGGRRIIK